MVATNANKIAAWRDTDPAVAQHYEIMQKYGGPTPTNFTIYAQILAEVAVEALKRSCDNLTREGFMEAMESIKDFHSDLAAGRRQLLLLAHRPRRLPEQPLRGGQSRRQRQGLLGVLRAGAPV